MKQTKQKTGMLYIPVKDYGDDWVNRLGAVCMVLGKMETDERFAALRFIKGKFSKEWPSDAYQ